MRNLIQNEVHVITIQFNKEYIEMKFIDFLKRTGFSGHCFCPILILFSLMLYIPCGLSARFKTEGLRFRASPVALRCVLEQDTLIPA